MKQVTNTRLIKTVTVVLEPEEVDEIVAQFLREDSSTKQALEAAGMDSAKCEILVNFQAKELIGCRVVFHQSDDEENPTQE